MGELNFFLGLQIKQTEQGIMIRLQKYIEDLIKKYGMETTSMGTNTRLDDDQKSKSVDQTRYRGMIGSLLYLTASRPTLHSMLEYVLDFNLIQKNLTLLLLKESWDI